ncbi:MAG: T9SS type A sorting domain-containing protein, partial [Bacteroidetes bacterium]|nr:T9SS type A sorting domain-containing protein [Bacteroidota bacterium]
SARGGAPAGIYPGENAIDTKYHIEDGRGMLFIKNTTAYGWRSDYIANAAAFNIKHNVEVILNGITTYDNDIAFRLRGPGSNGGAHVTLLNAIIYDSNTGVRYEDAIENLLVYNTTWGNNIARQFQSAGGYGTGFQVKNCLFIDQKPTEASDLSNLAVNSSAFMNVAMNDYHPNSNSPSIDSGVDLTMVTIDRDGVTRPQGAGYDIGAYEFIPAPTTIDGLGQTLPRSLRLWPSYPNPFNPQTKITYSLPYSNNVTIKIYDITGRLVERITLGQQLVGVHSIIWNASKLSSGTYFLRLEAGHLIATGRAVFLK